MSVSVLAVIGEAALAVGDPNYSHISREEWTAILNASCRDLARKLRLVLHTAMFDIVKDDAEYALPSDCIQVKSMRWNDNPSDIASWRWLGEKYEDEYRALSDRSAPTGDPVSYFVQNGSFFLLPTPDRNVTAGGKIQYWGMPDDVTDYTTQTIPVMDMMRDTLRERMCVYAFRRLEKWDAAAEREKEWQASLITDRDRLEDRSADRRPRMRSTASNTWGQR